VSPVILPDLSGVSEATVGQFPILPAGSKHNATVFEVTQESGPAGPYLKWQFQAHGPKVENRRFFDNTSFSDKSLPWLKARLAVFGLQNAKELDLPSLAGQPCIIMVGVEEYPAGSGQMQNNLTGVFKAGSGPVTDLTNVELVVPEAPTPQGGQAPAGGIPAPTPDGKLFDT